MSAIIRRILLSSASSSTRDDVFHRQVGLLSGILAVFVVAMALACQATGTTATPRIQPEDVVVDIRPTATSQMPTPTSALATTAPTATCPTGGEYARPNCYPAADRSLSGAQPDAAQPNRHGHPEPNLRSITCHTHRSTYRNS